MAGERRFGLRPRNVVIPDEDGSRQYSDDVPSYLLEVYKASEFLPGSGSRELKKAIRDIEQRVVLKPRLPRLALHFFYWNILYNNEKNPNDLWKAILLQRKLISLTANDNPEMEKYHNNLEIMVRTLYTSSVPQDKNTINLDDLNEAIRIM